MNFSSLLTKLKQYHSCYSVLFVGLICLENYILFFYSINRGSQWLNAVSYFVCSLLIGLLPIWQFKGKQVMKSLSNPKLKFWLPVIFSFGLVLVFFIYKDNYLFKTIPIDPKLSDVIPTIQVLVERFLNREMVYKPIEQFGYHLSVTYLPLQWGVYIPAGYFHFDYRWVTFAIWSIGCLWLIIRCFRLNQPIYQALIPLLLVGVYFLILYKRSGVVSYVVETMVAAYYIILIATLNQKNAILQGIGIVLCLLSRFSLVIWLPLWAFVLFISNNRKQLCITMVTVFALVMLLYVIPFLSKDWHSFFDALKTYSGAALGEWENNINYTIGKPYQLNAGTGIAFWFADHFHDNLPMGLKYLQRTGLLMYLVTVILLGVWYWKKKDKINMNIFLMASFKVYLTVFLFFIQVPYVYLMVVANFVSIAIFSELLSYKIVGKLRN